MNWADWIILAIVGISTLIGLGRGFVRETLSLLTWVAAFIVAMLFRDQLAPLLSNLVDTPSLQMITAFAILFFGTLLAGAGLNTMLSAFVEATGLSGTDRVLGVVFGLVRGGHCGDGAIDTGAGAGASETGQLVGGFGVDCTFP